MSKFKIWQPENGDTESDARVIEAPDEQSAVERWAEHDDRRSAEYTIVGGQDAVVKVAGESGRWSEWRVRGQQTAVYSASRIA